MLKLLKRNTLFGAKFFLKNLFILSFAKNAALPLIKLLV